MNMVMRPVVLTDAATTTTDSQSAGRSGSAGIGSPRRVAMRSPSTIEIHLPSRPRSYRRGDGPATAPPTIALPNDSTAYITEKSVLPLVLPTGTIKLQMHYLVRWTDLPAASLSVPATNILDYVSPWALENFEFELSLERDRAEEMDSLVSSGQGSRAEKHSCAASPPATDCRPPSGLASGPSLSTPRKGLAALGPLAGLGDDLNDDIEAEAPAQDEADDSAYVIFRQLRGSGSSAQETSAPEVPQPLADFYKNGTEPSTAPRREVRAPASDTKVGAANSAASPKNLVQQPLCSSGFTPAGRSAASWSPGLEPPQHTRREKRKGEMVTQDEEEEEDGDETVYVVKRLEGEWVDMADGKTQRYFQVRWEGNWPPDQNPTWEPQENLPPGLVRKYLKKRAKTAARLGHDPAVGMSPQPRRKYSNVAEAFEGEAEASEAPLRRWDNDEAEVERFAVMGSP